MIRGSGSLFIERCLISEDFRKKLEFGAIPTKADIAMIDAIKSRMASPQVCTGEAEELSVGPAFPN
jgi:hypothetical protein